MMRILMFWSTFLTRLMCGLVRWQPMTPSRIEFLGEYMFPPQRKGEQVPGLIGLASYSTARIKRVS